jgi:RNA polymerase sigma-70 factor (sigma-E family)
MVRRDEAEFLDFATAVRPQLRRTAYLICHDWDRAADIAQEALIRLYVAWPRLEQTVGLRAYARRVVVNAAIDQGRRRSSTEVLDATPISGVTADPSEATIDRLLVLEALAELPPRQRACVVLRYYEDLSVDDVAAALGCRAGTVKSQCAKGLATLREVFARHGVDVAVDIESTEARTW